jgi:hypothetical protein
LYIVFAISKLGAGHIETITLTFTLTLNIPDLLSAPAVFLLLLYRRLRYGCAFRRIPLTQGKFAIVDPDDYHRLRKYKWQLQRSPSNFYAKRAIRERSKYILVLMHREILKVADNLVVDHINHNGLDTRKANLRPATQLQNTWNNLRRRGKNRFRGVFWDKGEKKWQARLAYDYKKIHLGFFDDDVEAAKAYDEAAKKLRGEFAVLNFDENKNRRTCPLFAGKSGEG